MSCVNVQYIDGDECIGASLPKINGNFAALSAAVCELSANVPDATINVIDSPTIDLDWNASTRTLSAITTSMVATSSSPMVAKAWVNFNGKAFTNTTYPATSSSVIRTSYNVSSITEKALGWYEVNFQTPLPDQYAYALSLSAIVVDGSGDVVFHEGPYTSTKFGISVDNNTGSVRNESFMTCAIFFGN